MMKTNKRILALLLTVTALLGLMVPAVSAEETAAGLETVVYDFSATTIMDAVAKNKDNIFTPTVGSGSVYTFSDNPLYDAIAEAHSLGNLKWEMALPDYVTMSLTYVRTAAFNGLRVRLTNNPDNENYRTTYWTALPIDSPVAGTYNFKLSYSSHKNGIDEVGLYIVSYIDNITKDNVDVLLGNKQGTVPTGCSVRRIDGYCCGGETTTTSENAIKDIPLNGSYTFESGRKYMIVLRADKCSASSDQYLYISNATLTPSAAQVGDTGYTTVQAAVDAAYASETDKTVILLQSATEDSVEVKAGVTLDLNGKTLTANVKGSGTVTDSSNGSTGKIVGQSAVQNVGENEIALYDGTTTRIVGYTLTPSGTASASDYEVVEENGEVTAVKFWYTFKFDNDEAYEMIVAAKDSEDYANAKFTVGAELSFNNGAPKPADLKNATVVSDWAAAMADNTENKAYAFYVSVTGFDTLESGVNGTLGVKLTVNGSAGSAESAVINYTID